MTVNDIVDYVKHTPENTNPNVLSGMLEGLVKDNADFTNLKGQTVNIDWTQAEASDHSINVVTTSGATQYVAIEGEGGTPSKYKNTILIDQLSPNYVGGTCSGTIKKLDGIVIDLSTLKVNESIPYPFIPLSEINISLKIG